MSIKKSAAAVLLAVLSLAVFAPEAVVGQTLKPNCPTCVNTLVVLGSSYSDAGLPNGIWSLNNETAPPNDLGYFDGRYSNGPVYSEAVAAARNLTHISFAVANATANNATRAPSTLFKQVQAFKAYLRNSTNTSLPRPTAVIIEFGASDVVYLLNNATADEALNGTRAAQAFIRNITLAIRQAVEELIELNQKNIIILTVPPVDLSPYYLAEPNTTRMNEFGDLIDLVNENIRTLVERLVNANEDATILLYDINYWQTLVFRGPSTYGFNNSIDECMTYMLNNGTMNVSNTSNIVLPADTSEVGVPVNGTYVIYTCQRPATYFFWDEFYPSLAGHRWLAKILLPILRGAKLV